MEWPGGVGPEPEWRAPAWMVRVWPRAERQVLESRVGQGLWLRLDSGWMGRA